MELLNSNHFIFHQINNEIMYSFSVRAEFVEQIIYSQTVFRIKIKQIIIIIQELSGVGFGKEREREKRKEQKETKGDWERAAGAQKGDFSFSLEADLFK